MLQSYKDLYNNMNSRESLFAKYYLAKRDFYIFLHKMQPFPLAARLIVEEKNHLQEKQREEGQM